MWDPAASDLGANGPHSSLADEPTHLCAVYGREEMPGKAAWMRKQEGEKELSRLRKQVECATAVGTQDALPNSGQHPCGESDLSWEPEA